MPNLIILGVIAGLVAFFALDVLIIFASDRKRAFNRRPVGFAPGCGPGVQVVHLELPADSVPPKVRARLAMEFSGTNVVSEASDQTLVGWTPLGLGSFYFRSHEPVEYAIEFDGGGDSLVTVSCRCCFRFGVPTRLPRSNSAQMTQRLDRLVADLTRSNYGKTPD